MPAQTPSIVVDFRHNLAIRYFDTYAAFQEMAADDDGETDRGNLAPFFVGINAHFWLRSHHIYSYW